MTNVAVKAIIKYNQMDGQQVLYYCNSNRVVKMTNKKQVTRLGDASLYSFKDARSRWSRDKETIFVFSDEQPLLDGVPVELDDMVPFSVSKEEVRSFSVGKTQPTRKVNMDVNNDTVKILRDSGWTISAIAKHLDCSVATVVRKSA